MKKFILKTVLVLALLLGAGAFALTHFVTWEKVEPHVQKIVKEKTGMDLFLDGDFHLSFFPPAVNLEKLRIEKDGVTQLSAGLIQTRLSLRELFSGKIGISSITIADTLIKIIKEKDGTLNWKAKKDPTKKTPVKKEKTSDTKKKGLDLSLDLFHLKNVNIIYIDRLKNQTKKVENINITLVAPSLTEGPFTADGSLTYTTFSPQFHIQTEKLTNKKKPALSFRAILDGSTFEGNLRADLTQKKPSIMAKITADKIDTADFLPPQKAAAQKTKSAAAKKKAQGWSKKPLPLDALQKVNADITVAIASFKHKTITASDVALACILKNGALKPCSITAKTAGGSAKTQINITSRNSLPAWVIGLDLNNIQIEEFIAADSFLNGLKGKTFIKTNLTARGNSQHAIVNTLNGKGNMRIANGSFEGTDFEALYHELKSLDNNTKDLLKVTNMVRNKSLPQGTTTIQNLNLPFTVKNGILKHVGEIKSGGKGFKTKKGKVNINLPVKGVNMGTLVLFETKSKLPPLYVGLKGPFSSPKKVLRMDGVENMLKDKAKAKVKKKIQKKISKKLSGKLGDKLDKKLGKKGSDALENAVGDMFKF
ncbi:MAG: AsmA family protein [Alphaproteobacteria bacterium]